MISARLRETVPLLGRLLPFYAALFLFGTETFVISPLLPQISGDLGSSVPATAVAAASYVIVYAGLAPFLAYFSDTVSRSATLIGGLAIFVLGNALAAHSQGIEGFVAARAASGLGAALAGPAVWASIVALAPSEARSRLIGLGMAVFSLGQVAGVPAGGLITSGLGWRAVFVAIAFATALAAVAIAWVSRRGTSAASPPASAGFNVFSLWRDERASRILLLSVSFHAANLGAYAYAGAILTSRYGLPVDQIGAVGIAVGSGSIVGALLAGRLSDRARQSHGAAAGRLPLWCGLLALSLLATGLAPTLPLALVAIGLWFVASGAYVTDSQAIVTSVSDRSRSLASAWNTTAMHAGTAIGVCVLGQILGGGIAVFVAAALLATGALLFSLTLMAGRRRRPAADPETHRL